MKSLPPHPVVLTFPLVVAPAWHCTETALKMIYSVTRENALRKISTTWRKRERQCASTALRERHGEMPFEQDPLHVSSLSDAV